MLSRVFPEDIISENEGSLQTALSFEEITEVIKSVFFAFPLSAA